MPPAISDDEQLQSDDDEVQVPLRSKPVASPPTTTPSRRAAAAASASRNSAKAAAKNGDDSEAVKDDEDEEEDEDEDLDEDEYVVEKIMSHMVQDGELKFEVKWEGYEKKGDRTWESKENLLENASDILHEYLEAQGGEEKIMADSEKAIKGKKRGRPAANIAAPGKRRKGGEHPGESTPPASTKTWKPPSGSWEDEVESIDACHDENSGKLIVYLTWKNGQKTQHETKVIYQRCPQKMLAFYERHVKIVQ